MRNVWLGAAGVLLVALGACQSTPPTALYSVGGTVKGLAGSGLVLQVAGGEQLPIKADGAFTFPTKILGGSAVTVTATQQPTTPSQTCTVTGGSIASLAQDVTSIAVACTTNSYAIGGTVTGLSGSGLVLQDNAGDDLEVKADGAFGFPTKVLSGQPFTVTVKTQPASPAQTCNVLGGSGTVGGGDVTSVAINCSTNLYTIGGTVTGLKGSGLVLQNDDGDDLSVTAAGTFAFATPIASGHGFSVTVKSQPTAPSQTCSVSMGTGSVVAGNVSTVQVECATDTFPVGGQVTGLVGAGLVLQNNLGDNLPVLQDGAFAFHTPVESGASYAVTVLSQPTNPAQTCSVASGSGQGAVTDAAVSSVRVSCTTNTYSVGGTVTGLKGSGLVLQDNLGDDLAVTSEGAFTFATPVASALGYAVTVKTQPSDPWQTCSVTGGNGVVVSANVTSITVNCSTNRYAVGGTASGLMGSGLQLTLNGGEPLQVTSTGSFSFPTTLASGTQYTVAITGQPVTPTQTCTLQHETGTVAGADVASVAVTCTTNRYTVGGSVSGLIGHGLVLQDDNGDDLPIAADGTFTFPASIFSAQGYSVTVAAQPVEPWQTCSVASGAGTVTNANVTNVAVTCSTNRYAVGGAVTGLAGTLVLQDDAGDNLTLTSNGAFSFAGKIESGADYAVTVLTQPASPSQTCTVSGGTGTVANGAVTSVNVACVTNAFRVGGTVTGLRGAGLVLQDNAGDDLPVSADGSFSFPTKVLSGRTYAVTVKAQPTSPWQQCTVAGGAATMGGSDVTSVSVNCTTNTYNVGGSVTGLAGSGLVLQDNNGDDLAISGPGTFSFHTPVASGSSYAVSVKAQPTTPSQTCAVTAASASGSVSSANVTSVQVACTTNSYRVAVNVTGVAGGGLILQKNGADNLPVTTAGVATFATPVLSGAAYNVTVLSQPTNPWQTCTVANPTGTVGGGDVTLQVTCAANRYSVGGAVSGLTGSGLVLRDNGGDDLTVSANGTFTFATPVASGSAYAVTVRTQPATQTCYVTNGTGTMGSANVTNVSVACAMPSCQSILQSNPSATNGTYMLDPDGAGPLPQTQVYCDMSAGGQTVYAATHNWGEWGASMTVVVRDRLTAGTASMAEWQNTCALFGKTNYVGSWHNTGQTYSQTNWAAYTDAADWWTNYALKVFPSMTYNQFLILQDSNSFDCWAWYAEAGSLAAFGSPTGSGYSFCRGGATASERYHIYLCK